MKTQRSEIFDECDKGDEQKIIRIETKTSVFFKVPWLEAVCTVAFLIKTFWALAPKAQLINAINSR